MGGVVEDAQRRDRAQLTQLAVLAVAVAVAASIVGWLLVRSDGGTPTVASAFGPALVSQERLEELSSPAEPIYWAGPKQGFSYELTRSADGRSYVRYLPGGVAAGDRRSEFLVVGTYERPHAFGDLKRAGTRSGAGFAKLAGGGGLVFSKARPQSVYFSYPGSRGQVEVYAPSGERARTLVLRGKITPIR
jgi:hypothetical protein